MKKINHTIFALSLVSLLSCGQQDHQNIRLSTNKEDLSLKGDYQVILRPLNHHLSGWIPNGKSEIKIDEDKMNLSSWLDDSSSVPHRQFILTGKRCPVASDDLNQDGVIDVMETFKASGKVLIPLDDNLGTQISPYESFPFGNFSYQEEIKISALEDDLREVDLDTTDHVVKLPRKDPLNLENKVMIVLGVSEKRFLPDSIQALEGVSRQLSTPIVCGLIQRK